MCSLDWVESPTLSCSWPSAGKLGWVSHTLQLSRKAFGAILKWPDTPKYQEFSCGYCSLEQWHTSQNFLRWNSWAKWLEPKWLRIVWHTVLYLMNCIPLNCKNGSGSALEFQNANYTYVIAKKGLYFPGIAKLGRDLLLNCKILSCGIITIPPALIFA